MPNIYLRLPSYVCALYRNRDIDHPLKNDEPVKFCEYSHEYVILSSCVRIVSSKLQAARHCYSQNSWNTMLRGKELQTGAKVIIRNPHEWLTSAEIKALAGEAHGNREEVYDYLCIGLPKEAFFDGRVHRTNGSFSLDGGGVNQLERLMRNNFVHLLLDWLIQSRRWCNQMGVERSRLETLERFLMVYGIPVSVDNHERESLRRMMNRWMDKAGALLNDRVKFRDPYFAYLTSDEVKRLQEVHPEKYAEYVRLQNKTDKRNK